MIAELLHAAARTIELVVGWIFSPSWLPPADFNLLRWLFVPGYGYGFVLLGFLVLELVLPQVRRPWSRATLLSGTYVILGAKMGFYGLIITPLITKAWLFLGLPSLHLDRTMPLPLYMTLAMLVTTFTAYWAHRLMHRVPLFWDIHKIHHSVQNLNVTSSYHKHFLEMLLSAPLHLATVLMLGTDLVAPFGIIFLAVDFLSHSNVRLNLGPLSYVLCTPQAHRIHHSVDPRHYDTNFCNTFMLWDHVFGTFHYDPANLPTKFGLNEHVPVSFVQQQFLPLVWIAKALRPPSHRGTGTRPESR